MKLFTIVALFVFGMALPAQASDVQRFTWDGTGSEHIPCAGAVDWLMTTDGDITAASVGVNDADGQDDGYGWAMTEAPDGSWSVQAHLPLNPTDEVTAAFVGTGTASLRLVDCEEAVVIPTTNPAPTPPTQSPTTPTLVTWTLGFRVRTVRPTNIVAKWRIVCDGVLTKGKIRTKSPVSREFTREADECHITVRSWDVKPYAHPNDPTPPFPKVDTWISHD